MTKGEILRAVRAERRATLRLLRGLDHRAFDTPTALPGWRIREVVAHLITTDRSSILGTNLAAVLTSMDRIEAWNDGPVHRWADRPVPDLLVALDRWGRRFARFIGSLPKPLYRLPAPTAWGRSTTGFLISMRAYDEWVHRQDIRRALELPDEEVDAAAAAEILFAALRSDVRRWTSGSGTVLISLPGTPVTPWRFDLEARTAAPANGAPDDVGATVAAPAEAFIMAAAGRDSFDALRAGGRLTIDGDEALGTAFLARVRIV